MPLMRYFVFVGGALLALLFVADACLPALPVAVASRSDTDLSVIRIHSDRKWPERVVFDTTRPTITPAPAPVVAEAAPVAAKNRRGAFERWGQGGFCPIASHSERASKRKRKSVARSYAGPNYAGPPRMLVAQQRPVFFFGNNIW